MNNLLAFVTRYYHWLLFLLLEVASIVLLLQKNSYQNSVWFTSANAFVGSVYRMEASVTSFFSLTRANEELTLRNFYLERQVGQLRRLYGELTSDTTVLERQEMAFLSQFKLIPAKVVSNSLYKKDNLITIDRGRADGVEKDMGVACGLGVVGVVYQASDHYAVVIRPQRHLFACQLCHPRAWLLRLPTVVWQRPDGGLRRGYSPSRTLQAW